jgi:hypothetical protein
MTYAERAKHLKPDNEAYMALAQLLCVIDAVTPMDVSPVRLSAILELVYMSPSLTLEQFTGMFTPDDQQYNEFFIVQAMATCLPLRSMKVIHALLSGLNWPAVPLSHLRKASKCFGNGCTGCGITLLLELEGVSAIARSQLLLKPLSSMYHAALFQILHAMDLATALGMTPPMLAALIKRVGPKTEWPEFLALFSFRHQSQSSTVIRSLARAVGYLMILPERIDGLLFEARWTKGQADHVVEWARWKQKVHKGLRAGLLKAAFAIKAFNELLIAIRRRRRSTMILFAVTRIAARARKAKRSVALRASVRNAHKAAARAVQQIVALRAVITNMQKDVCRCRARRRWRVAHIVIATAPKLAKLFLCQHYMHASRQQAAQAHAHAVEASVSTIHAKAAYERLLRSTLVVVKRKRKQIEVRKRQLERREALRNEMRLNMHIICLYGTAVCQFLNHVPNHQNMTRKYTVKLGGFALLKEKKQTDGTAELEDTCQWFVSTCSHYMRVPFTQTVAVKYLVSLKVAWQRLPLCLRDIRNQGLSSADAWTLVMNSSAIRDRKMTSEFCRAVDLPMDVFVRFSPLDFANMVNLCLANDIDLQVCMKEGLKQEDAGEGFWHKYRSDDTDGLHSSLAERLTLRVNQINSESP